MATVEFITNSIGRPTRAFLHDTLHHHTFAGMTAHPTLQALARLTQQARVFGRSTSTSCAGAGPPSVPPPCTPHPRPPCRARPEHKVQALRVVCCPPTSGQRPPCPQPEQTPSHTCAYMSKGPTPRLEGATAPLNCGSDSHGECGVGQDRVARRLALAKSARRKDYEREAALPRERIHAIPYAEYKLGCDRECARATDGRDYSVPCGCPERPQPCGPERTPPPPHRVDLAPDDRCRIDTGAHLNPCAHRPRILLQIDRSAPQASTTKCEPCPSPRTLKSRIMQSLKPRPNKNSNPLASKPKDSPQCCRRNFHVSALYHGKDCPPTTALNENDKKSGSLEGMLKERAKLHEAGQGRAVCGTSLKKRSCPDMGVSGQLELPVLGGARRVRVQVAMEDDCGMPLVLGGRSATRGQFSKSKNITAMTGTKDSWLSIKNIQKKICGCKNEVDAKEKECSPKKKVPTNPCDSPQTKSPPPAKLPPRKPCPPKESSPSPCEPKKSNKEEKEKPKPLCPFLPLVLTTTPIL